MFDMKMPPKMMGKGKIPEGSAEEESMEDPNYEMEEDKDVSAALQAVSDEELLAELKKRGLSPDGEMPQAVAKPV